MAETLTSLCLKTICDRVSELNWIYVLPLPHTLKEQLVSFFDSHRRYKFKETLGREPDWLYADASRVEQARIQYVTLYDWSQASGPLPRDVYAFIMRLNIPQFYSIFSDLSYHFIRYCYVKTCPGSSLRLNLCELCFLRDSCYRHAHFRFERTHEVRVILFRHLVQDPDSWCSNCVTMPLFRVFSDLTCPQREYLMYHEKNLMYLGDDDDSSEDDTSDSNIVTHPLA